MKWDGKVVVIRPNLLERGLEAEGMRPLEEWFVGSRPSFFEGCKSAEQYQHVPLRDLESKGVRTESEGSSV